MPTPRRLRRTPARQTDFWARSAIRYPLAGGTYRQTEYSYPVWMAQRLLDALRQSPENDQRIVGDWLAAVGGSSVLHLDLPRVTRVGLAAARIA
jgi:hypothetical protein